jgi:hypothetical protein
LLFLEALVKFEKPFILLWIAVLVTFEPMLGLAGGGPRCNAQDDVW